MLPRRLAALLASLVLALACSPEPGPGPPTPDAATSEAPRHLILLTLDTLRADHLGVYGGDVATPNLDRLAREGAWVEQASTHVPLTRPSHVSLFTGQLPLETGIRDNVSPVAMPEGSTLAEVLREAGFTTGGFVSSVVLSSATGLGRGFGTYSDDFEADPEDPRFLDTAQRRGDETVARALAWLRENREAPRLFLWVHLYDPHDPYEPPEPYRDRYRDRPYAGEVAWTDELVGRLVGGLEALGLASRSLLAVTSDHGEGLGEHGELLHGFFAYESTLRVPLIFHGPGIAPGGRLAGPVGLVDLFPTFLDLLGVPVPSRTKISGRSLAAALGGAPEGEPRTVYAESLIPRLHFGWSDLRVARQGPWKYIQAPRPELYDLASDPGETRNLIDERRPRVRELQGALREILAREETRGPSETLPPELLEKLHALGYVGSARAPDLSGPVEGLDDPKDKIEAFRRANQRLRQGLEELHEGRLRAAAQTLGELLEEGIESPEIHLYRGRAFLGLGRFPEAAKELAAAAEGNPAYAGAWLGLAEALVQQGDAEGALQTLAQGRQAVPSHAGLHRETGRLLRRLRRPAEAREVLDKALSLDGDDPQATALLGDVLRELGDLDASAQALHRAVELAPDVASYWNTLGMTLAGRDELAEAEGAFRRARDLDPRHYLYAYNLGLALLRQGKAREARKPFEDALALEPRFAPARERLAEISGSPSP